MLGEEGQGAATGCHFPLLPDTPAQTSSMLLQGVSGATFRSQPWGSWRMGCSTSSSLGPACLCPSHPWP